MAQDEGGALYQECIRTEARKQGHVDIDPRHVEGYMRLAHASLDGLSRDEFICEVALCISCVDVFGRQAAEENAKSFGL